MIYQFPTKEEYLKNLKEADNQHWKESERREFFNEWCEDRTWDIMTDHTSESFNEDEAEYLEDYNDEELYKEMLQDALKSLEKDMRFRVPLEVVEKYATKEEVKAYKRMKEMELLEEI